MAGGATSFGGQTGRCRRHRAAVDEKGTTVISASKSASWSYTEDFLDEPEEIDLSRARAQELGCRAVSPGTGALLRMLSRTVGVKTAVEVGTGAGVSGLYLLAGLPASAVLTTIDIEAEHLAAARAAFAEADHRPNHVRVIHGDARDVLPRLAEATYDLVVLDLDRPETALELADAATALLRPHGLLVVLDALHFDRVPDPARRDPGTVAARDLLHLLSDSGRFDISLVPTGDGVLLAAPLPSRRD